MSLSSLANTPGYSFSSLAKIPGYEELPAGSPPPGVIPNFEHPESRAYQFYAASAICLIILGAVVAIRGYAKTKLLKSRTMDDSKQCGLIALKATCLTYIIVMIFLLSYGGVAEHIWDVQIKVFNTRQLSLTLATSITYGPVLWFPKVPLLLMYLEVFGCIKWVRYLSWIALSFTAVSNFGCMIVVAVSCSPNTGTGQLDYLNALNSPTCKFDGQISSLIIGCVNVAFDVFLLILPLQPIWSLQLSTSRKLAVSALVLTGILAIIASCVALWFRVLEKNNTWDVNSDSTWNAVSLWIVMIAEMTCAMIIAAAPSISVFWAVKIVPLSSRFSSKYHRLLSSYKTSTSRDKDSDNQYELSKHRSGDASGITMTREFSVHDAEV